MNHPNSTLKSAYTSILKGNIISPETSNLASNKRKVISKDNLNQTNGSMPLFVLDNTGDKNILGKLTKRRNKNKQKSQQHETKTIEETTEVSIEKERPIKKNRKNEKKSFKLASSIDSQLSFTSYLDQSTKIIDVDQILKSTAPPPDPTKALVSKRKQKLLKTKARKKVAGDDWFNMGAPEMSRTIKNELTLIQMRNSLDPKRFYKSNDRKKFPRYFQMGTVVESPADFYHSRIPKKQRKANMVEEMMADAEMKQYIKRKHGEVAKKQKVRKRNKNKIKIK
ncbi:hypothetical protein Ahia01_000007400 [Argonauta hians]